MKIEVTSHCVRITLANGSELNIREETDTDNSVLLRTSCQMDATLAIVPRCSNEVGVRLIPWRSQESAQLSST